MITDKEKWDVETQNHIKTKQIHPNHQRNYSYTTILFYLLLHQADTGPVTFAPLFQGNPFNRPQTVAPTSAPVTQPPLVTTTDPDDVIYSDELKPVHEDYDPINEPYVQNKLPPG